ncbi:threonine/serine exporter family protein [Microbacterium sp. NPDC019599]|uniref:threonine/serine ThrE exporter family protein n=1 Tax=Microbacterium sp. NPDC019599 TaxID=3154690 RepID=UPI0033D169D8
MSALGPGEHDEPTETAELRLEPLHFIARVDAVLRLGRLMLGAGASSARVRDSMKRVAHGLAIDGLHSRVGMTDIVVTAQRGSLYRTRVAEVRPGVDADRIVRLQRLSHRAETGATASDLQAELEEIEASPPRYATALRVAAAAAACAAFALLNNGGWAEALAVGLAVAVGQWLRMVLLHARINEFFVVFLSAVVALLGYFGIIGLLDAVRLADGGHDAAMTSAVLFLVPGFALVTGAMDLARLDLHAGIARVTYACLVLLATGTAVWAIAAAFQSSATLTLPPLFDEPALSVVRMIAGFTGVLGFALLFCTPWRIALLAAVIGAIVNLGRLLLVDAGAMPAVAAALAGLAVGVGAFAASRWLDAPRVTLAVPAVLIMVPGAAAYRAIVATIDGDTVAAVQYGVQSVSVVVALAIGLTVARILTEREWGRT